MFINRFGGIDVVAFFCSVECFGAQSPRLVLVVSSDNWYLAADNRTLAMTKDQAKQRRYDTAYMRMALEWADYRIASKRVGSLIVKDRMIISDGYNGAPTSFDNR